MYYQPTIITKQKIIALGTVVVLVCLMLITNYYRFGSPLEFGHSIHASRFDLITYTTVFSNPFKTASVVQATKDFLGSFFYTPVTLWKEPIPVDMNEDGA